MFQVFHMVEHTKSCSSPSVLGHSQVSPYGDLGIASFCVSLASIFFTWARFEHNCRVYLDIAQHGIQVSYKFFVCQSFATWHTSIIQLSYEFFWYASLFDLFMDIHLQVLFTRVLIQCLLRDIFLSSNAPGLSHI